MEKIDEIVKESKEKERLAEEQLNYYNSIRKKLERKSLSKNASDMTLLTPSFND